MIRVLLDTISIVAGLSSSLDASFALLRAVAAGRLQVAASPVLWLEYETELKRDEIRALHSFSPKQINNILFAFATWVLHVRLHYVRRPQFKI